MRFLILAFNPESINIEDLAKLVDIFQNTFSCDIFIVPHKDKNAEPLYCVQFADTPIRPEVSID